MASRGLGTLTIDLVAKTSGFVAGMDKAERSSKKWRRQVEKDLQKASNAIKIGAGVAVAALGTMAVQTANSARELQNLSRLSNTSTQEFQRMAYGARRYGIEQDKLSDILKDTNDRIGDFIQTGGGPMADFFENIAPLVGVTADDFARLSGPEALQLYVKSLEDANLSQADMTFYMEAIASDATALIPLLKDNGREMRNLGDEAERVGAVLSDVEIGQLEEMRKSFDQLAGAAEGVRNQVVMAAIPAVNDLMEILTDPSTIESAQTLGTAIVKSMNFVIKAIDGAVKVTQFLAEELAAMTNGANPDDIVRLQDELETLYDMLDNPTKRLRFFGKDGVVAFYDEAEIRQMIADTENKIVELRRRMEQRGSQRKGAGVDLVTPEIVTGGGYTPPAGGTPPNSKLEQDLAKRRDAIRQSFETERQTVLRIFKEQEEEIRALRDAGVISEMEAQNLLWQNEQQMFERRRELREQELEEEKSYWQRWIDSAQSNLQNFDDLSKSVIDNFTTGFGSAIEGLVFDAESLDDALKGIAETILRGVVNSLAQMAAQWLALQAVQAIVGAQATAATVGQAAISAAAWAPAAAAASLATLGTNAAPASAALVSTNALSKTLALTGMAHDGIDSVPKTGTWLLEKGERVLTSETSKKLDAKLDGGSGVVVNLYEDASKAGQVQQGQRDDGTTEVNVFVSDIMSNGPRAKALQRAYGLRRQGT